MEEFQITKLWSDFEIAGRFYCQALHLNAPALVGEKKAEFFQNLASTMHKHTAIRSHLQNYKVLEQKALEEFTQTMQEHPNETREAFELIRELEAFFFQVKSSLDMLVKILNPILGKGFVRTQTYGDEGEMVVKGLKKYCEKKGVNAEAVKHLIDLVLAEKEAWLAAVVECRDVLAHTHALRDFKFTCRQGAGGLKEAVRPCFRNHETVSLLEWIAQRNLEFQQAFLALSLAIVFPKGFGSLSSGFAAPPVQIGWL